MPASTPEHVRLEEDAERRSNWKRWGPYLAERAWGTVREDYSADGSAWDYFPHDHARSRAYRWNEDGLLGLCDREGRMCFSLALWNGKDPYLKERLFGLSNAEGVHGEDVKEEYFYVDATPTHSYGKALYRFVLDEFPYARLVEENRRRTVTQPEANLVDCGVFEGGRFVDVTVEHAKASPDDVLVRLTFENRASEPATLDALPTLWWRNTWSWGRQGDGYGARPRMRLAGGPAGHGARLVADAHAGLESMHLVAGPGPDGSPPTWAFTENETNAERLFGARNPSPYVKDAFHALVVGGRADAVNPANEGTKAAARYRFRVAPGGRVVLKLRLFAATEAAAGEADPVGASFDRVFAARVAEADAFYDATFPATMTAEERNIARQGYAGLLFSKQFFHFIVSQWLEGDPAQPAPPSGRRAGRNADWAGLHCRDVLSMPDKWEYPWFAAWDLAFHVVPLSRVDLEFSKQQLVLFLREWYLHASGQIPAYEWALGDVNPPVHAWACRRVYERTGPPGGRDQRS